MLYGVAPSPCRLPRNCGTGAVGRNASRGGKFRGRGSLCGAQSLPLTTHASLAATGFPRVQGSRSVAGPRAARSRAQKGRGPARGAARVRLPLTCRYLASTDRSLSFSRRTSGFGPSQLDLRNAQAAESSRPPRWRCRRLARLAWSINERVIHPLQPYLVEATANQLEYFDRVFGLQSDLSPRDQIWYWKELLGVVANMACVVGLVPLASLLLRLPDFSPLVHPLPPALPRPRKSGRVVWCFFSRTRCG